MNSTGPKLAQYNPCPGENTRPRPWCQFCTEDPSFLNNPKESATLLFCLTDICVRVPSFLTLYILWSSTANRSRPSSGEPALAGKRNG
jgi:hypothetical protein